MQHSNIYQAIRKDVPDRLCIISGKRELTYADLLDHIHTTAVWLREQGIGSGDRVAIRGLAGVDYLVACYGCAAISAVPVPVSFQDEDKIAEAIASANAQLTLSELPEAVAGTVLPREDDAGADSASAEAMVIYTSGTTSDRLKGVRLGHAGILSTADFMNRAMGVDDSIRENVFAALDHAYGFGRCQAILMVGGVLVLPTDVRNLLLLVQDARKHQCNALSAAPSIIATLMQSMEGAFADTARQIRWLQTGAMRFDSGFRQRLIAMMPEAGIFLHYGLSEAMRVTFLEADRHPDKLHTEGPPAEGVEIAILDDEMQPVDQGEEGTIAVRGRNLCLGYLDENLWQSNLHEGWFVTSDRGLLDSDGYLVFAGRRDDVININGVLVHPDAIESLIRPLFPTQTYTVVGIDDPAGVKDRVPALVVEGDHDVTLDAVASHMRGVEPEMVPVMVRSVEVLPRTRSGKVVRSQLAKQISGDL